MSLITIASQILAVILLELFEKGSYSILVWLTVMLFLPKIFLMAGMILPFESGPIMDIAMWMPVNFLPAGTRVTMSECVTLWSSAEGMTRCLVSGAAGILIFSSAGVFLLRKKDLS